MAKFGGTAGKLDTLRNFTQLLKLSMGTTLLSGWVEVDWLSEQNDYTSIQDLPPDMARLLPSSLVDLNLSDDYYYTLVLPDSDDETDTSDEGPYWFDYPASHWWDVPGYDFADSDEFGSDDSEGDSEGDDEGGDREGGDTVEEALLVNPGPAAALSS